MDEIFGADLSKLEEDGRFSESAMWHAKGYCTKEAKVKGFLSINKIYYAMHVYIHHN